MGPLSYTPTGRGGGGGLSRDLTVEDSSNRVILVMSHKRYTSIYRPSMCLHATVELTSVRGRGGGGWGWGALQ